MGNKICVSLGSSEPASLGRLAEESFKNNADFVEIRFDYLERQDMIAALDAVLKHRERAVFTCRSPDEGGRYKGTEQERITTLRQLAAFGPMLLDVELSTMAANEDLVDQFAAIDCNIMTSWHNFDETPATAELVTVMKEMKAYGGKAKIVTTAKDMEDNLKVLKLYETARKEKIELVSFCMGEHGLLSRVMCTYAGSPFTYASLVEAVAPGQLTVGQMRAIYDRLKEKTVLTDYDAWKDRREFSDVMSIIRDTISHAP